MTQTTRVIDVGLSDAMKNNKKMNGSYTKVGFPQGEPIASGDGETDRKNMVDLATNAAIFHFGIDTKSGIKRWPFMTNAFSNNKRRVESLLRSSAEKVYKGKMSVKRALGIIGEDMTDKVKQEMRDISSPKEEEETIRLKQGVSNPTIDTGQMVNSVTHVEVVK
jgi:hypothetical protein